jgi:hypothetical protein
MYHRCLGVSVSARCVNVSLYIGIGPLCKCIIWMRAAARQSASDPGVERRARRGAATTIRLDASARRFDFTRFVRSCVFDVDEAAVATTGGSIGIRFERVCVLVLSDRRGTKGDGADDGGDD